MARKLNFTSAEGPFKCRFCTAILFDKESPSARDWDWVTGYLPTTEHCCPKCLKSNPTMWRLILKRAQAAPSHPFEAKAGEDA